MVEQALSDLKVLDLTHYIAGPYCTKLLADYAAEVVKIERPGVGDGARMMGPFPGDQPDPEKSGIFLHLNTNKRGITLNLKSDTGRKIFFELVKWADILVENFSPRVMPALGLTYEILEKINPQLVMASISNFGQTGPYRDYKATEIVGFAMGGRMYSFGEPDREPLRYGGSTMQYLAGSTAAMGTISAYFGSKVHGAGQQVDVSIMEVLLGAADRGLLAYSYNEEIATREGNRRPGSYAGIFKCKDGYVMVAGGGARQWPRVMRMLERSDLIDDPRFSTAVGRREHVRELDDVFISWMAAHTRQEIFHQGQKYRVLIGPIYTVAELLEDPQIKARNFFVEIDHPKVGKVIYPGAPFKMSETPWEIRRPAPLLGQHNEEIYCGQLGYNRQDLVKLRERGII